MLLNKLIKNFQSFLIASWPQMSLIMEHLDWDEEPYFIEEWVQLNWELLVEKHLGEGIFLLPYGYDANPKNRKSEGHPTHKIICEKVACHEKYNFMKFVSKKNNELSFSPPFDYIAVTNVENKIEYLKFDNMEFFIEPIHILT